MTGSIFVIFEIIFMIVLGHLHSANVIQIAWMAVFLHFSIDFLKMFLCRAQFCLKKLKTGYCLTNFTPGQGIIFRNLTPGQGSF